MSEVRLTSVAADQLERVLDHLDSESPQGARRVRNEIRRVLERLELFPESGSPTDEPGIRYVPIPRTRYLIFYDVDAIGVRVVRIRHSSRRPLHR